MDIGIPKDILGLNGQRVNKIKLDEERQQLVIHCHRDKRRNAVDPVTGKTGTINRYVRREVRDVPLFGYPCVIDVELAQVFISKNERRMEKPVENNLIARGITRPKRVFFLISYICSDDLIISFVMRAKPFVNLKRFL